MDLVKALKSNAYLTFYSKIKSFEDEQHAIFQEIVSDIEAKFAKLLNDDNSTEKPSEFLVPELPKYRKDGKGKRTSRATKKASEISKTSDILQFARPSGLQSNYQSVDSTNTSQTDDSTFRRSSRIASKTQVPIRQPSNSSKTKRTNEDGSTLLSFATAVESESQGNNETFVKTSQVPPSNIFSAKQDIPVVQPILPNKTKDERIVKTSTASFCISSVGQSVPDSHKSDESFRRSYRVALKHSLEKTEHPLKSGLPNNKKEDKVIRPVSQPPSPCLPPTKIRCVDVKDSKKMSISRRSLDSSNCSSEIKEPLGSSTPTNLTLDTFMNKNKNRDSPLHTPIKLLDTLKKPKVKATIFTEEGLSASKGRCTRNMSKILQEKNVNVKLIEEKCHEAQKKKEVMMKSSAEETRRKREERTRKAAAAREAVERERIELALKQKQEKEKEMKLKQVQKQKEEKLRIEVLKKKQIAAMKMAENEKRKQEEHGKEADQKKPDSKHELHEYIILDGASSDEEDNPKSKIPSWAKKENRKHQLRVQAWLDREKVVRPWFFNNALKYPKLETLFSDKVKTRPRTSSAFWNTQVNFDEAFPLN